MSSLIDIWVSELAKLAESTRRLSRPSPKKAESEAAKEETPAEMRAVRNKPTSRVTVSEATLFMVMDRFAPY
ncbi:hypothetical protein QJS10_CPA05g01553 [Acorus calamus]|uniref:Uncharacterized protein n=1 Tax=Acorus calamus TaxID=4465 RepID=A0AAV9ESV0_ACOCL|nr:hypothetical protein QJS10_CPA05g01553 [Acorus calamus]